MNATSPSQTFFAYCQSLPTSFNLSAILSHDINLTLLKWCIWYAYQHYGRINRAKLLEIDQLVTQWNLSITKPLRSVDGQINTLSHLKKDSEHAKVVIAAQQCNECVQINEHELFKRTFRLPKAIKRSVMQVQKDACSNLAAYLKIKKIYINQEVFQELTSLLHHYFSTATPTTINNQLAKSLSSAKILVIDSFQLTFANI